MSGGILNTLFDGVIVLFRVKSHWLSTRVSAGASSETVPSNRTMIRGFVPAFQFAFTYASANVSVNICESSSYRSTNR